MAIDELIIRVAAVLGSISTIVLTIVAIVQPFNAIKEGIKELLHFRLNRECERIISRGWASYSEIEDLGSLYARYKALKGNGSGDKAYELATNVDVLNESEAQKRRIEECFFLQREYDAKMGGDQ